MGAAMLRSHDQFLLLIIISFLQRILFGMLILFFEVIFTCLFTVLYTHTLWFLS